MMCCLNTSGHKLSPAADIHDVCFCKCHTGLLDYVLSDYLWARAVMLLGPTVATLSLSVQIPLAAVADVVMGEAPEWTQNSSKPMS